MTKPKSHVLYTTCPHCGKEHDRAGGLTTHKMPKPGDISLCINCGGWNEYDDDLHMKKLPQETLEQIRKDDPQIKKIEAAYRTMKGLH